ncbi:MAG TPA: hypothetical protein VLY23_02430 [Candidatus Acidoferrum sp.]|nr:hypothetical protein [Candidatus Acidoferrum sp.]
MQRRFDIPALAITLGLCSVAAGLALPHSASGQTNGGSQVNPQSQAPSDAEFKARTDLLIAHQHADDLAGAEYEHIERQIDRSSGLTPQTLEEKTYRVVPTGTGTLRILLKNDGKATNAEDYRKQLRAWKEVLELALRPDDPRAKSAYAKFEKKKRDRAEMVDATRDAFLKKWVKREMLDGFDCDVVELEPNPAFHPHSLLQEAVTHFRAKIWVDHDSDQLVHAQAEVIRDISFGGGILGKLYRGGVFSLDQAPVAPGIWLARRYQYDFSGRKFLFMFEVHQVVESRQYHRVGPPKEALALVQNEMATGKVVTSDP